MKQYLLSGSGVKPGPHSLQAVTAEEPVLGLTALAPQRVGQALALGHQLPTGQGRQAARLLCPGTLE